MGRFALAHVAGNVGQFEELPAGMCPAQRTGHRAWIAAGAIEIIVSAIGVSLQNPLPSDQVLIGIGC